MEDASLDSEASTSNRLNRSLAKPTRSSLHLQGPPLPAKPLCSRCAQLDMDELFRRREAGAFNEVTWIFEWKDKDEPDWLKSDCPFCRLVFSIQIWYNHHASQEAPSSRGRENISRQGYLYALRENGGCRTPIPLGLHKSIDHSENLSDNWTWVLYIASRSSVYNQGDLIVRSIEVDTIDFDVVRRWWTPLSENRETAFRPQDVEGIPAKVIDCRTRRIVTRNRCVYVALSYVWGKPVPGYDDTCPGGKLPHILPATAEDAIIATQQLGYRYLWVDKYCIDQANEEEKWEQIRNMDIIYKGAEVTIVAAAGRDAHFGLPGLGTRPRIAQRRVCLGDMAVVMVQKTDRVQATVRNSEWNSRAWTYQEARLSHRLLIFTEDELYFESREGNLRETVEPPFPCMEDNLFISHSASLDPWQDSNPETVARVIAEYSTKNLTRQEDALDAALGILKSFQVGLKPVYHHWGVPIFPDKAIGQDCRMKFDFLGPMADQPFSSNGFFLGLSWQNAHGSKPTRRPNLPSWSWAGWSCELLPWPTTVAVLEHFSTLPISGGVQAAAKAYLELRDGTTMRLEYLWESQQSHQDSATFSQFILLDAYTFPLKLFAHASILYCFTLKPSRGRNARRTFHFNLSYDRQGNDTNTFISMVSGQDLMQRCKDSATSEPLLGLLLWTFSGSKRVNESSADSYVLRSFVLVLLDCGEHYERVGYILLEHEFPSPYNLFGLGLGIRKEMARIG